MGVLAVELAYWQETVIKLLLAFVAVLIPAGATVYLYLFKMVSFMQSRLGPMEAGPFGSLQLVAELGKFAQKEDIVPRAADRFVFAAAPYVVLMSTFLLVLVVPFGPDAVFANLDTGVFFALAVTSVSVIGVLMAGWASASKYSLLGGLRAAGQLIAYELPLVLAVVGVVIQAGSLNMQRIVQAQIEGEIFGWGALGNPFILTQLIGFFIFMIAVQAELTQTPFDMPIAESELVARLHDRVLGLPVPAVLHRRVRNRQHLRLPRRSSVPRRLVGPAVRDRPARHRPVLEPLQLRRPADHVGQDARL